MVLNQAPNVSKRIEVRKRESMEREREVAEDKEINLRGARDGRAKSFDPHEVST